MDKFQYEVLLTVLTEKIESQERLITYYKERNDQLEKENYDLKKQNNTQNTNE